MSQRLLGAEESADTPRRETLVAHRAPVGDSDRVEREMQLVREIERDDLRALRLHNDLILSEDL